MPSTRAGAVVIASVAIATAVAVVVVSAPQRPEAAGHRLPPTNAPRPAAPVPAAPGNAAP